MMRRMAAAVLPGRMRASFMFTHWTWSAFLVRARTVLVGIPGGVGPHGAVAVELARVGRGGDVGMAVVGAESLSRVAGGSLFVFHLGTCGRHMLFTGVRLFLRRRRGSDATRAAVEAHAADVVHHGLVVGV